MKVVIIDGQGGRLGQLLTEEVKKACPGIDLLAIGTNSIAAAAMLKAGAQHCAMGENPVVVACRDADVIIGPIGILAADSMYGEVTPAMATAIGQSSAIKLLVPLNVSRCNNRVVGVKDLSMAELVKETAEQLKQLL